METAKADGLRKVEMESGAGLEKHRDYPVVSGMFTLSDVR